MTLGCPDMSENVIQNGLSRNQVRAISALLSYSRVEFAARSVGINPRTIYRWMQEPAFIRALRTAEGEVISDAVRVLISDLKANLEVMRAVRDDPENSARVRLSAAQILDNSLLRWREMQNVEERLANLEELVQVKSIINGD